MSATVNNAGLGLINEELIKEELIGQDAVATRPHATQPPASADRLGHEALQALLAFSALHEQIRTRRAKQVRGGGSSNLPDDWQLEQFVLDEVLQLVADRALAITGADGVAIALAEGDAIVCRASAGNIAPDTGVRLDPSAGFSGECLVSGRIVRCDDADTDSRVNLEACRRLGVRSMLAIPLSAKQSVIGLLEAFSNEPHGFNDSDVRSLNLLAELILSAMKPEEEDRLSEISRRVVHAVVVKPEVIPANAPATAKVELKPPAQNLDDRADSGAPRRALFETGNSHPDSVSENSKSSSPPLAHTENEALNHSRPGLVVVAVVVLFAVVLGAGVWWTLGHRLRAAKATGIDAASARSATPLAAPPAAAIAAPATMPSDTANKATADKTTETEDESEPSPSTSEEAGLLPKVTGIRHWSSDESSTVVIDMQDQVQYEAHRLTHPERIYFDLHDTTLAAVFSTRTITVNDTLLQRVRVAQPMAGVTRVVLETNGASDFSVSLEPNPFRLVVEVRKLGTKPHARAKIDLFAPVNPAPVNQAATKVLPTDQVAVNQTPPNQISLNPISLKQIPLNPISRSPVALTGDEQPATSSKPLYAGQPLTPLSAAKLCIVLDAGHGGWDLGGVGRHGLLEKDLVLDIVERLGHLVESRLGANVIYTRKDDSYLSLEKRAEIANLARANLFLSVHANYSDYPSARGVETYYTNTYSSIRARTEDADDAAAPGLKPINWTNIDIREKVHESRKVAANVQRSMYAMLAANNPGLRNRGVKKAQYVVLTGTSMPAILAEVSFVSSPTDENNLQSSTYREQIAEALYTGIARYQASNPIPKVASASAKPAGR